MDTLIILGTLIILTLFGSLFVKSYLEKQRIERARQLVDLHDDLRRMQNALAIIPELYLDTPTKLFMIKRLIQLIDKVQEIGNETESLNVLHQDLHAQMEKAMKSKDDSAVRLSKWAKIDNPDTAHEIKMMIKFLHDQILTGVKTGLIPRAHAARVVKNLKVMMHRLALDLNYNLARAALRSNKLRPALGKLRVALGHCLKSPIKQYLGKQKEQLESLIEQTDAKIVKLRKEANRNTSNKLSEGVEKIDKEDEFENKKNIYD